MKLIINVLAFLLSLFVGAIAFIIGLTGEILLACADELMDWSWKLEQWANRE